MVDFFGNFFDGKKILVTGHTGFKGSWLSIWLHELGANVYGIALDPASEKDNYVVSGVANILQEDIRADIRDANLMKEIIPSIAPDMIFHLAAQPLVRLSYEKPLDTYMINVIGTLHILEAMRLSPTTRVGIMVTSDKCYENKEQPWGYRECDAMGGHDPYSSSKGAAEVAISSWRRSFFNPADYGKKHQQAIASVRAGNVIGGGDWAIDRIIPDCIRAIEQGQDIKIRSPHAIRPWQHVLEPLSGYMLLAQRLWESPTQYCQGWNFGPDASGIANVWDIATILCQCMGCGHLVDASMADAPKEANLLLLDTNKARLQLGWKPRLSLHQAVELTAEWYKKYGTGHCYDLCVEQIAQYVASKV